MKKLNNLFLVIGLICFMTFPTSCGTSKKASGTDQQGPVISNQKGPVMLTQEGLASLLGSRYNDDAFVKGIHVYNGQEVTFTAETKNTDATLDNNGNVLISKESEPKKGVLKVGTEGRIDSVVRYDTYNIAKFRIEYFIPDFGSYYMWYYRKTADNMHYWYASNNIAHPVINGIRMARNTFDNRLHWNYSLTNKNTPSTFDVLSPFGNSSNTNQINPGGMKKVTNGEEVEEN